MVVEPLIVIVTGTRHPQRGDVGRLWTALDMLYGWSTAGGEPLTVIHGAAPGIDTAAATWLRRMLSTHRQVVERPYKAQWHQFGKAAGPIRNRQMWTDNWHRVDLCLAIPSPQGTGTQDCMRLAGIHSCPVWEIPSGVETLPMPYPPQARLIPGRSTA